MSEMPNCNTPVNCVQPQSGGKRRFLHRNVFFPIGSATPVPKPNRAPRTVIKSTSRIQSKNIVQIDAEANSNSDSDSDYYVFEQPK